MFGMTFLSSISMQREKIGKQFKETVQKHSNLIYSLVLQMIKLTKPKLIFKEEKRKVKVKRKRLIDRVKKMSPFDENTCHY